MQVLCGVSCGHQRSLEHKAETIGDQELTLVGIERTVCCDNQPTTWQCYFTADRYHIIISIIIIISIVIFNPR